MKAWECLAIGFLVACGGDGFSDEGPISIERTNTHVLEDSEMEVPAPFVDEVIAAWALDPDTGEFIELTVEIDGATATIPDAPKGDVYIWRTNTTGPRFHQVVVTSRRQVDFGEPVLGRPDVAADHNSIGVNVTGLEPWQDRADELHLFSAGAGFFIRTLGFPSPDEGATQIGHIAQYLENEPLSVDASAGDVSHVYQMSGDFTETTAILTAVRYGRTSFTSGEGLMVALAPAATTRTLDVDLRTTAFRAAFEPAGFQGSRVTYFVSVFARPGSPAYGAYSASADLVIGSLIADDADFAASIEFTDGLPEAWPRIAVMTAFNELNYGMGTGGVQFARMWVADELDRLDGTAVEPRIGPPQNVTVDGQATVDPFSLVSATPTVSWEPPETGDPDHYRVILLTGSAGPMTRSAVLSTVDTSVRIPPGLLAPGFVAFFVQAIDGNSDIQSRPFRLTYPEAGATTATAAAAVP